MAERQERPTVDWCQPVLHVRDNWRRDKEWPADLQQRGPLDRLHDAPEVAVAVAEIAKPSPAWPRLDRHREPVAGRRLVVRPHFFQERFEGPLERGADVN